MKLGNEADRKAKERARRLKELQEETNVLIDKVHAVHEKLNALEADHKNLICNNFF